jgi:hypothetical protein
VDDPASTTLANMTVFLVDGIALTFEESCALDKLITEFQQPSTTLVVPKWGCRVQADMRKICSGSIFALNLPTSSCVEFAPNFPDNLFEGFDRYVPPVDGNSSFVLLDQSYMQVWVDERSSLADFPYTVVSKNRTAPTSPQSAPAQPDMPPANLPPEAAPAPWQPEMSPAAFQPEPLPAQPSMAPVDAQPEIYPANPEPEMAHADLPPGTSPVPPQSGGLSLAAMWGIASAASVGVFLLATQLYRRLKSGFTPGNPSQTTVTMSPLGLYTNQASASSSLLVQSPNATTPPTSVRVDSYSGKSSVDGSAFSDDDSKGAGAIRLDDSDVLGAGHSSGD